MTAYTYYPGCTVGAIAVYYEKSLLATAPLLGAEFIELEDWNCCGATTYMSVREVMSLCIAARNLALAEPLGRDIVTPCSACYTVLSKANAYFKENRDIQQKIEQALRAAGLTYKGTLRVRHALDVYANDIGYDAVRAAVKVPLEGLKVAPYYGCQVVRPILAFDDPEFPQTLDRLIEATGAEAVNYPLKAKCCGASLSVTAPESAFKMIHNLLKCAVDNGADVVVTPCPMCAVNLETFQGEVGRTYGVEYNMPILFFPQLLGLAMGVPNEALGLDRLFQKTEEPLGRFVEEVRT